MSNQMNVKDSVQKRKKAKRMLMIIFSVLIAAVIGCGVYIGINASQIWGGLGFDENEVVVAEVEENTDGLPEVTYNGGKVSDITKPDENIIDIMLIGVDNRNSAKFTGLSDVMIYMRVDTIRKSIKLASFMRDTLVKVEGYGESKLNSAYSRGKGKIDLMYQTYDDSFGLKPDYYMVVNFYGMEDIIDDLGGVDVELKSSELESLNSSIQEINKIKGGQDVPTIRNSGLYNLNGRQAVAYMRIRHPGGDAARIARQQTVLFELFEKTKDTGIGEIPGLISALAKYVRTDIPPATLIELAKSVQGIEDSNLQTFRYPEDYENGYYKGVGSIVQPKDFDIEFNKLYEFLTN